MSEVEVYDDFLEIETFLPLQSLLLGEELPWHYNAYKSVQKNSLEANYDFQFIHKFYENYSPISPFVSFIEPLIAAISPLALVRIKANLTPMTQDRIVYGFHRDFEVKKAQLKTAVFYVNTNDGATVFSDGQEVESRANRFVVFDSNFSHAGTSCTNSKTRVVLNLNFIKW